MLESQSGPFASKVFTTVPYTAHFTYPNHLFRVLLLRRLRLPLPLTARACRCRRALNPLGDHRAACPRSGALRSRGTPLERAAARFCREGGAPVTTHTLLSDLNIDRPPRRQPTYRSHSKRFAPLGRMPVGHRHHHCFAPHQSGDAPTA